MPNDTSTHLYGVCLVSLGSLTVKHGKTITLEAIFNKVTICTQAPEGYFKIGFFLMLEVLASARFLSDCDFSKQ